jgi:regulator of sirC expression with transglutaminase-like and TPR domain
VTEDHAERQEILDRFAGVVQGSSVPLDLATALVAAHEQPGVDPDRLAGELDELAGGLHIPPAAAPLEQIARVNHHLFVTHGFVGDEERYDDPRNSCLNRVLERRKGLPILLCVVMIEVARRVDVAIDGVGFPGHFVVSPRVAETRFFVDPFHGGRILRETELLARLPRLFGIPMEAITNPQQHLRPVSARELLVRVNVNLKHSWLHRDDAEGALRAVDRLIALDPSNPAEHRDRRILQAQLGRSGG